MTKEKEPKTTNEKPVKIPLDFKEALAALLNIKPHKEKAKPKRKPPKPKK
jgi:hypothetical protein